MSSDVNAYLIRVVHHQRGRTQSAVTGAVIGETDVEVIHSAHRATERARRQVEAISKVDVNNVKRHNVTVGQALW